MSKLCKDQAAEKVAEILQELSDGVDAEDVFFQAIKKAKKPTPQEIKKEQFQVLVNKGLLDVLGMGKDSAWSYVPDPEEGHDSYLLVCNAVPLSKLVTWIVVNNKSGKNHLNLNFVEDVIDVPKTLFYWKYEIEDGREMLNKSPNTCEKQFKKEKRKGLTAREGAHKCVYEPEILKDHYMDCPGSRLGGDRVPYLNLCDGRPGLCADCAGHANPSCGSASSGK